MWDKKFLCLSNSVCDTLWWQPYETRIYHVTTSPNKIQNIPITPQISLVSQCSQSLLPTPGKILILFLLLSITFDCFPFHIRSCSMFFLVSGFFHSAYYFWDLSMFLSMSVVHFFLLSSVFYSPWVVNSTDRKCVSLFLDSLFCSSTVLKHYFICSATPSNMKIHN